MPQWALQPQDETERSLSDAAELALQWARELGADMAETALSHAQGMSVTVRTGDVETLEHDRAKDLAVKVYFGQRSGRASSTDFSPAAIASSVQRACDIAKYTETDKYAGLADKALLAVDFPDLDLLHPWAVSTEEAIEIALQCEAAALDCKGISNSEGASVSSHRGVTLYANSDGFRGLRRGSQHSISCAVIAGADSDMQRDHWYDAARAAADMQPAAKIGERAAHRTLRRQGARKIRTGEYPVLFEPTVAASLLGHLTSAISGSSLYQKASFLLDHAGKKIFADGIRIHEQPHLRKSAGAASFDAEGVATRARDIVRDGVLQGYLLGSYSARKLGLTTTANAGGVHNLEIQPTTNADLAGLIAQMGRGVVVSELIGFGVNTVTGDYSRGGFGFWVENGEIQYPVQEFTIASNLRQMFLGLAAVGSDTDRRGNLRSGAILLKSMTVAGA